MEFDQPVGMVTVPVSWQTERTKFGKHAKRIIYYLSFFLSIWFETITEVDTLKIRKKGVLRNDELFLK
ncbi:MAG: hypothetical protein FIB08_09495 [Candidatus Methanoperedens sp.]|nr:hypothetical protein [Candidatus Methanoperedens sp.]